MQHTKPQTIIILQRFWRRMKKEGRTLPQLLQRFQAVLPGVEPLKSIK